MIRRSVIPGFVMAVAILMVAPAARAAATIPPCEALLPFAAKLDPNEAWRLSAGDPSLSLPALFHTPAFDTLFGTPALDWTKDDLTAARTALTACARDLAKAKKRDEATAVNKLRDNLMRIGAVRGRIDAATAKLDTAIKALLDQPATRDQLAAILVVDHARAGGDAVEQAKQFMVTIDGTGPGGVGKGIGSQAHTPMGEALGVLRGAPDGLGDRMYPALAERRDAVVASLTADALAGIAAVPESPDGLAALKTLRQQDTKLYAGLLPAAEIAKLDAAFVARDGAIQDAVQAKVMKALAAVPADAAGLSTLRAFVAGPVPQALSPARAEAIRAAVAARRDAILDGMTEAAVARVAAFPADMAGLRALAAFTGEFAAVTATEAGPARVGRFAAAADQRLAEIGAAALPAFETNLAALPNTRDGLSEIDKAAAELQPTLARLPPPVRDRYVAALGTKHAAIDAGVKAEDDRLAALPLAGATYAEGSTRIEFRSSDHAFVTDGGDTTLDVTYEEAGDRVILHGLPRGNVVLQRQGGQLVGAGMRLARAPG